MFFCMGIRNMYRQSLIFFIDTQKHVLGIVMQLVPWIWMCILVQSQCATPYDFTECEWGKQRSAPALGGV